MGEAVKGGHHYQMLFMLGALLFVVTFFANMAADFITKACGAFNVDRIADFQAA